MKKVNKKNNFELYEKIRDQDWFGSPVALNFGGADSIKSLPGAFISLILLVLLIAYTMVQG